MRKELVHLRRYHQERVNRTYRTFYPNQKPFIIDQLIDEIVYAHQIEGDKCRIAYNAVDFKMEVGMYSKKDFNSIVLMDSEHINYAFKYSNRGALYSNHSDKRKQLILFHSLGRIKDFSHANILLEINGEWLTPQYPLLHGCHRDYLVANKIVREYDLQLSDLKRTSKIKCINALSTFEEAPSFSIDQIIDDF